MRPCFAFYRIPRGRCPRGPLSWARSALSIHEPLFLLFGFALVVVIRWLIACSQLCGLGHYRMRGYYAVQSDADFNAWFAEETALLTEP